MNILLKYLIFIFFSQFLFSIIFSFPSIAVAIFIAFIFFTTFKMRQLTSNNRNKNKYYNEYAKNNNNRDIIDVEFTQKDIE